MAGTLAPALVPATALTPAPLAAAAPVAAQAAVVPTPALKALVEERLSAASVKEKKGSEDSKDGAESAFNKAAGLEPAAPVVPYEIDLHGKPWTDPYHWMNTLWKQEPSAGLVSHVDAENRHTHRYFKKLRTLRARLLREFRAHAFAPLAPGGDVRAGRGARRKIDALSRRTKTGWKQVVDLADWLPKKTKSAGLDSWTASPDGKKFILNVAVDGDARTFVYDGVRKRLFELSDPGGKIETSVWSADGKSVVYARNSLELNKGKILARVVADDAPPSVLFSSDDETAYLEISKTRDGRFLMIGVKSYERREAWAVPADRLETPPVRLAPQRRGSFTYAEHQDGRFLLRANGGNGFFSLYEAAPGGEPRLLLAGSPESDILDFAVFDDRVLVTRRVRANPVIEVYDRSFALLKTISFPEATYELEILPRRGARDKAIRIRKTSLLMPEAVYSLSRGNALRLVEASKVPALNPADYVFEKRFFKSADGTDVPMTVLYKKDAAPGPRPAYYSAYGAYDAPYELDEDHAYNLAYERSLLDRGFVVAVAHVRGGMEKGLQWMLDGRREKRALSIEDFLAGAEHLIASGLTEKKKIAVHSYSAGGTLIGAAVNRRPDLFGAAVIDMGYLDYVNSELDPAVPAAALEWSLWGNPRIKEDFDFMAGISPYDTVKAQEYPPLLLNTARDDWAVLFHESAKYAARVRAARLGDSPVLLSVLAPGRGDHNGRYGRHDLDAAYALAFVLRELGVR